MSQFSKVILILSPGLDAQSIRKDLLENTVLASGAKELPEGLDGLDHGVYVEVSPNHSRLNDIISLPDCKVIIQTHTIGQISHISSELFASDKSEIEITNFTRGQHSYKRLLAGVVNSDNLSFLETSIGNAEGVDKVYELGVKFLAPEPEPQTVSDETNQSVDVSTENEGIVFEKNKDDANDQPVETVSLKTESLDDQKVDTTVDSPEPKTEVVIGTVTVQDSNAVNQLTNLKDNDLAHVANLNGVMTPTSDSEVVSTVTTTKVEESKADAPSLGLDDLDFEQALASSLAKADEKIPKTTENEDKPNTNEVGKAVGIPDVYPNVGQTVTFNEKDLFKPYEGTWDNPLYDFAGTPNRFNFYHAHVVKKLDQAMGNPDKVKFSDFESAVLQAGEDRVAGNSYEFQYHTDARWSNLIKAGPTNVPIIMPIRDPEYGSAKYFGPETVSLLQNRMKTGCKLGVFLPHTGIYFVIVSPHDGQFIDTLAIINNQRIQTLRASSGILLGNSNFYINRQVMKLFIDSIVHCSLTAWNRETLMKLIDERDIAIIAQTLGASIYPDGYDYVQVCGLEKTDGKVCTHETRKLVDLRRMIFVDNSRLSEAQKIQAAQALAERSVSDIERYKEANYIGFKKAYEITQGVEFVYRAQSALTSIEAGEKWIKEIEAVVDSIITFNNDEDTRNLMIEERIGLTRIREFSHWIEEILIDSQPMTDRTKIDTFLNSLSRNKDVVKKVSDTLTEFQRLSSIAMVAIPRCPCPECKATDERDLDIATHLIPQDSVSRLFTLVRQFQL